MRVNTNDEKRKKTRMKVKWKTGFRKAGAEFKPVSWQELIGQNDAIVENGSVVSW